MSTGFKVSQAGAYPVTAKGNTLALCWCVINEAIKLRGIKLIQRQDGTRNAIFPLDPHDQGRELCWYHPINGIAHREITQAVSAAYDRALARIEAQTSEKGGAVNG